MGLHTETEMRKAGELEVVLQEGSARLADDDTRSFLVNTAIRLHNPLFNLSR